MHAIVAPAAVGRTEGFQGRVRRLLLDRVLAAFHKFPYFLGKLKGPILNCISDSVGAGLDELGLHLCWVVGEYANKEQLPTLVLHDLYQVRLDAAKRRPAAPPASFCLWLRRALTRRHGHLAMLSPRGGSVGAGASRVRAHVFTQVALAQPAAGPR